MSARRRWLRRAADLLQRRRVGFDALLARRLEADPSPSLSARALERSLLSVDANRARIDRTATRGSLEPRR